MLLYFYYYFVCSILLNGRTLESIQCQSHFLHLGKLILSMGSFAEESVLMMTQEIEIEVLYFTAIRIQLAK